MPVGKTMYSSPNKSEEIAATLPVFNTLEEAEEKTVKWFQNWVNAIKNHGARSQKQNNNNGWKSFARIDNIKSGDQSDAMLEFKRTDFIKNK